MELINAKQGSEEWHQIRATHFTASDAPAMLGFSKYKTRPELLREKATGVKKDTSGNEYIFQKGHDAEAAQRPLIEEQLGIDFSPVVGSLALESLPLLASFDGIDINDEHTFEHKLWNQSLVDYIEANKDLPDTHWPQVEHQFIVSGAQSCYFVVSDGTEEKRVILHYKSIAERSQKVVEGWKLFQQDLKEWKEPEQAEKLEAQSIESLPSLSIELEGKVLATNLDQFKAKAESYVDSIKTNLVTDQDFINADADVKFLKKAVENLDKVKKDALSSTADIEALFGTVDDVRDMLNKKRISLEKDVKSEKDSRKSKILNDYVTKVNEHIKTIDDEFFTDEFSTPVIVNDPVTLMEVAAKGKKTLQSVEDACDAVLTELKLDANEKANALRSNLKIAHDLSEGYEFLFPDMSQNILKPTEDLENFIKMRIKNHEDAEAEKLKQQELEKQESETEEEPLVDADDLDAREQAEIEELAESLELDEEEEDFSDIHDPQGMAVPQDEKKTEVVDMAETQLHSSEFDLFSMADIFAEFELEEGTYSISIKKVD